MRLNDIKVGSGNTITSLSFDPNALTFEMDRMYAQGIESSSIQKRPEYVADKEKIKAMQQFMEEMRKQKETLEEVTIYHDKDESHRVDIIVPNFTIHIGGKTLIDDASLKISFGRRYVLIGRNGIGKTTLLNHIVRKEIDGIPKNSENDSAYGSHHKISSVRKIQKHQIRMGNQRFWKRSGYFIFNHLERKCRRNFKTYS